MKRRATISVSLLLFLTGMAVLTSGCSKKSNPVSNETPTLTGTWNFSSGTAIAGNENVSATNQDEKGSLTLNGDGSFQASGTAMSSKIGNPVGSSAYASGTYAYSTYNNTITFNATSYSGTATNNKVGSVTGDYTLSSNTLIITFSAGGDAVTMNFSK